MSNRSVLLSPSHYASKWNIPGDNELNDRATVNALAITYANLPDGPEKQDKCLEIVQCFHGYIMKYLHMIVRGHLPSLKTPAGKDAAKMLRTIVPKGKKVNRETLGQACRSMHLAFKQSTTDDIYDALVMCIMRAIRKYDPHYTTKVRDICQAVDRVGKIFTGPEISESVGFDSASCLRMLVRRGHLASVAGPKKKVIGYRRTTAWPPDEAFFNSGPVGFVYFLPMYFRYYLHEYISDAMSSIESKEGMLQLDHRGAPGHHGSGEGHDIASGIDRGIPNAEGDLFDQHGQGWSADLSMLKLPLDISTMDMAWVKGTNDKLFRKLTNKERYLLYLLYVKELKWSEIAGILGVEVETAKKSQEKVMEYLKARANPRKF